MQMVLSSAYRPPNIMLRCALLVLLVSCATAQTPSFGIQFCNETVINELGCHVSLDALCCACTCSRRCKGGGGCSNVWRASGCRVCAALVCEMERGKVCTKAEERLLPSLCWRMTPGELFAVPGGVWRQHVYLPTRNSRPFRWRRSFCAGQKLRVGELCGSPCRRVR